MKKIKHILSIALIITILCSGCAPNAEDAGNYVMAILDAKFSGNYEALSKLRKMEEADVQKEIEEAFIESTKTELAELNDIPTDSADTYRKLRTEMKRLATYALLETTKVDDRFEVKINISPSNVFITYAEKASSLMSEKMEAGITMEDTKEIMDVINEALQYAIEQNSYLNDVAITVTVSKDENKAWAISSEDMQLIEDTLFPN